MTNPQCDPVESTTPQCDALERNRLDSNDIRAWNALAHRLEREAAELREALSKLDSVLDFSEDVTPGNNILPDDPTALNEAFACAYRALYDREDRATAHPIPQSQEGR